jgi:putative hemolysin
MVKHMKVFDEKDLEALSPLFRGETGHRLARFILRLLSIDKVNKVYNNSGSWTGAKFARSLLNDLGVNYIIGNAERLEHLPEEAFITVSNHPYGGLDGIILIDLIAGVRADYKLMVNKIISLVKTMQENFISVIPSGNKKEDVTGTNIHAVRETISHLQEGHPVGFFPSGAVSDFSFKDFRIRDRKWQMGILHVIHHAKVPVLPIRFFDTNSKFFYFLGLLNWRIRSLRLPSEVFNKEDQHPRLAIGNIISVKEQERFNDADTLGAFLRQAVYTMPMPPSFIPRTMLHAGRVPGSF